MKNLQAICTPWPSNSDARKAIDCSPFILQTVDTQANLPYHPINKKQKTERNDFEKDYLKLMNNAVLGNYENVKQWY